jgi:hypothetical protein
VCGPGRCQRRGAVDYDPDCGVIQQAARLRQLRLVAFVFVTRNSSAVIVDIER